MMRELASDDPAMLLGTTPQGNTCLHIAAIYGHEEFCKDAVELNGSLLDAGNDDGETPLLTAVVRGHANLASVLLSCCREMQLRETIMKQDKHRCNALHHAIRRGYRVLALELIEAEPDLSKVLNERDESPMFIAVMRGFRDVVDKLLEIPESSESGALGFNVLHAAVQNGNSDMVKRVLETRPELVGQENKNQHTPMHLAVNEGKVDVLTVLLEHDPSLGYLIFTDGAPLLSVAASQGHIGVARELLKHCPDAPYCDSKGSTCLHVAVSSSRRDFVKFVLQSQELQHLINVADESGKTALHLAATNGKSGMVDAFMLHQEIDATVLDNGGNHARALIAAAEEAEDATSESESSEEDEESTTDSDSEEEAEETTSDSSGAAPIDRRLLKASLTGDAKLMKQLVSNDPAVLLGTTPQGNTCLHISAIHGHEEFCKEVVELNRSVLDITNTDGETPLLIAVIRGHASLASVLLRCCSDQQLRDTILKQDKRGCNALHHAVSGGHRMLALELIEAEPALSKAVNKCAQSPMFMAVMSSFADVLEKLLEIPYSAHSGDNGFNALHAAVRKGDTAIAKRIVEKRPRLVRQRKRNPMHLAAKENKVDVLSVLLEHDPSLGYLISKDGTPLLCIAASHGHVGIARELLKHCPDAACCDAKGSTCLHLAVSSGQAGFVKFVLESQELQHLINAIDNSGKTALRLALASLATNSDKDDGDGDGDGDVDGDGDDEEHDRKKYIAAVLQSHLNLGLRHPPLEMDRRLLEAATSGHAAEMMHLSLHVPRVLLGTTPRGTPASTSPPSMAARSSARSSRVWIRHSSLPSTRTMRRHCSPPSQVAVFP